MSAEFTGLTWDHPRGYDALAEAARLANKDRPTPLLHWDKQPLEGFESAPIAELAAAYDLLVLDHPHIGEAVADDCLIPLDQLYEPEKLKRWRAQSIGPSLASYAWRGRVWALPLDVATQVMARRPDRLADPPRSWDEVMSVAEAVPIALSIAGPHALLTWFSLAASSGAVPRGDDLLPDEPALAALDRMHKLHSVSIPESRDLNPIALLERMARGDDLVLVPLVFGYVTYAVAGHAPSKVAFSDTPREPRGHGGVLGGTGIAFTKRSEPSAALLEHIAWLLDEVTQTRFLPANGGQPSARAAWRDETVNERWGHFYRSTFVTAEAALLRPRFDGYIRFQSRAGELIRQALAARDAPEKTLSRVRILWREARATARDGLDDDRGQP
ncbi:MAG: extracellular solute-binding protein [Geminicoccaceae bacterium]